MSNNKMKFDPEKYHRRSIRLSPYDYAGAGSYFVTICSKYRECIFGEIENGGILLNEYGGIVESELKKTGDMRERVCIDEYIIMPNHVHVIINITPNDCRGMLPNAQVHEQFGKPTSNSIPTIVRLFKSAVTLRINEIRNTPRAPVWQRNYFERILRDEIELEKIRRYIKNNPYKWEEDENNPKNIKSEEY